MKKLTAILLTLVLLLGLCACANETTPQATTQAKEDAPASTAAPAPSTEAPAPSTEAPAPSTEATEPAERTVLNVYSLKGPTTMGIVTLLEDSKNGLTKNDYQSTICTTADEVTLALVEGRADIALLPANAAASLYRKAGGFSVVAINTLGVLYVVENGETVNSVEDLAGKTVCLTGKGTTPEYALRYLLAAYGIEDQVTLEFKSESQEVVAAMNENVAVIGLLPQPFVSVALTQNEGLRIALDVNAEWDSVSDTGSMVTGVTVVRTEILKKYPQQIADFLEEAAQAVDKVYEDQETAARLIVEMGIVAKEGIVLKALPYCNLVCITGSGMKDTLSGYLQTLYDQNPKAVGGKMPNDDFYYTGE